MPAATFWLQGDDIIIMSNLNHGHGRLTDNNNNGNRCKNDNHIDIGKNVIGENATSKKYHDLCTVTIGVCAIII